MAVLLNTTAPGSATPTFAPEMDFSTGEPRSAAVADVSGDGKPDIIVANYEAGTGTATLHNLTPTGSMTPFTRALTT